ncbi:hypothetical protein TNCV_2836781 [Trichonephila clavipes]|nr:hypothetical protein TNCV_2836781 [Trichonephila clavipes]
MQNVTNERGETKSKPKCVVDYNDQMGGADKVDQHLAPYFTSRKREENTNIFFHLLENHRDEFSATSGKPSISPSPLRLTSMHFSDVIPASEKIKSNETVFP